MSGPLTSKLLLFFYFILLILLFLLPFLLVRVMCLSHRCGWTRKNRQSNAAATAAGCVVRNREKTNRWLEAAAAITKMWQQRRQRANVTVNRRMTVWKTDRHRDTGTERTDRRREGSEKTCTLAYVIYCKRWSQLPSEHIGVWAILSRGAESSLLENI